MSSTAWPAPTEPARGCAGAGCVRSGGTLVIAKLERPAWYPPDARDIVEALTEAGVKLNIGGSVPRSERPGRRRLFSVLALMPNSRRTHQNANSRGHEDRQGGGSIARKAAQTLALPGGSPGRAVARGQAHQRRAGRAVSATRSTAYGACRCRHPSGLRATSATRSAPLLGDPAVGGAIKESESESAWGWESASESAWGWASV